MIKQGRHFITLNNYTKNDIMLLLDKIQKSKTSKLKVFQESRTKKLICNLFYEPSTRTSSSFYAAAKYLGHEVLSINNVQYSSVSKGETLEDTIRTLGSYTHCIVLRHPEVGSALRATEVSDVPIINAGDGVGEHPTQTLLDLYTIYKEYQTLDGLTITVMGDLKFGRTVHSLVNVLKMFNCKVNLVSPPNLQLPMDYSDSSFVSYNELNYSVLQESDVLYITRVQAERGAWASYRFETDDVQHLNQSCIVMHPLPRVDELPTWFDDDPRARYFEQMSNGLAVRKFLLKEILS